MQDWILEAQRLRKEGHGPKEIARRLFPNEPEIRAYERVKKGLQRARVNKPAEPHPVAVEGRADGTTTFSGIIALQEGQPITPEAIMKAHKLNAAFWEVVSYKSNFWETQTKGAKKMVLYQSKITVKPRKGGIQPEDIERFFSGLDFTARPGIKPAQYDPDGEVLEICVPDLHSGLLSWRKETGEDYDHYIAAERLSDCISDILARCEGKRFSKILFVTLGDLLHIDNLDNTTTKGTRQDTDSRFPKIFESTLNMLVDIIVSLEHIAPVEVVYIQGNHDGLTGYTLLTAVNTAFRNDPNVTVDAGPNPRKWRRIGKNLIGWCHGDMPSKTKRTWLHQEAREAYGETEYAEVHAGHLHSQSATDENGIVHRDLPTVCAASAWEHKQGYISAWAGMISFVWAPNVRGPRDMWFSNIKERSETA